MKMKLYARMKYLLAEGFSIISTWQEEIMGMEFVVLTYSNKADFMGSRCEIFEDVSPTEYRKVLKLWEQINKEEARDGTNRKNLRKGN